MKKRSLALTAGAVALVGAVTVGGTLAYLTGATEEKRNVFTGSNTDLEGTIVEEFDEEKAASFIPGDAIAKEVSLQNDCDLGAYVAIKLDYLVNGEAVSYDDFKASYAEIYTNDVAGFNTVDWTQIDMGDADYDFFMYNSVLAGGAATELLFTDVVVSTGIQTEVSSTEYTKKVYKEVAADTEGAEVIDGKYYVLVDAESVVNETTAVFVKQGDKLVATTVDAKLPQFEVVVTGYMVQADNMDAATAQTELIALLNEQ